LLHSVTPLLSIIDAFKGDKGAMALPNLAPNKFQERPSGASGMQENLLAAGAPTRISLGELTAFPQTTQYRRPVPTNATRALGPSGYEASALAAYLKQKAWPLPT